ncbi:MAG: 4-hydroxy-tetrahydrodipicolinate reductase [Betaproteobacteria bacterium]|nr:4-hydroxy-tetrahydrodipicolinate reductase [Betaproteobacteria bacterium]
MALKLAIAGAGGRMGRMLLNAASADRDVALAAALEHAQSPLLGQTIAGLMVTSDLHVGLGQANVLIDFTRPEGTRRHLAACAALKVNAVIGTTGFSESELREIKQFSEQIAIVLAPNMSLGVNVTATLVGVAAQSLGLDADIEVFEAHHKLKVDAPSGTALMLGRVAAEARGQDIAQVAVYERHAVTAEREPGTIGFSTLRAGDIIGDHTVFFVLNGERIEITHRASSRETYAHGAIRAAKFLSDKRHGLFDMNDVLGLHRA